VNRNVLVRIGTSDPGRIWSGSDDLYLPADGIETEGGARYIGGGSLLDGFDDIEQLINGIAARIPITVSGVTADTVRLTREDDIKGAIVDIGIVEFDDLWQIVGVTWTARYRIDKISISRGETRTISLSMGSDDTGRSRTINSYFTDADQRRRSSDDRIFDQVAAINAKTSRNFGPS
jgi:hypothetical protein